LFAGTSARWFFGPFMRGHTLGGGSVPFVTQSRNARRMRLTSAVDGTGFASKVPLP